MFKLKVLKNENKEEEKLINYFALSLCQLTNNINDMYYLKKSNGLVYY